jgi:hypothetical protein
MAFDPPTSTWYTVGVDVAHNTDASFVKNYFNSVTPEVINFVFQ